MWKLLATLGCLLTPAGFLSLAAGLIASVDQAVSRFARDDEHFFELPSAQDRIRQSRWAKASVGFVLIGCAILIGAIWLMP